LAPGMPKTYLTPCASRLLTSNSAPVCGLSFFAGSVIFISVKFIVFTHHEAHEGHEARKKFFHFLFLRDPFDSAQDMLRALLRGESFVSELCAKIFFVFFVHFVVD
jgi:hypothetical protein